MEPSLDGLETFFQTQKTIKQAEWWGETELSYPTAAVTSTEPHQEQLGFTLHAAVLGGISTFTQFVWPWHLLGDTLVICKY